MHDLHPGKGTSRAEQANDVLVNTSRLKTQGRTADVNHGLFQWPAVSITVYHLFFCWGRDLRLPLFPAPFCNLVALKQSRSKALGFVEAINAEWATELKTALSNKPAAVPEASRNPETPAACLSQAPKTPLLPGTGRFGSGRVPQTPVERPPAENSEGHKATTPPGSRIPQTPISGTSMCHGQTSPPRIPTTYLNQGSLGLCSEYALAVATHLGVLGSIPALCSGLRGCYHNSEQSPLSNLR